jgi:hypothetical protein
MISTRKPCSKCPSPLTLCLDCKDSAYKEALAVMAAVLPVRTSSNLSTSVDEIGARYEKAKVRAIAPPMGDLGDIGTLLAYIAELKTVPAVPPSQSPQEKADAAYEAAKQTIALNKELQALGIGLNPTRSIHQDGSYTWTTESDNEMTAFPDDDFNEVLNEAMKNYSDEGWVESFSANDMRDMSTDLAKWMWLKNVKTKAGNVSNRITFQIGDRVHGVDHDTGMDVGSHGEVLAVDEYQFTIRFDEPLEGQFIFEQNIADYALLQASPQETGPQSEDQGDC